MSIVNAKVLDYKMHKGCLLLAYRVSASFNILTDMKYRFLGLILCICRDSFLLLCISSLTILLQFFFFVNLG